MKLKRNFFVGLTVALVTIAVLTISTLAVFAHNEQTPLGFMDYPDSVYVFYSYEEFKEAFFLMSEDTAENLSSFVDGLRTIMVDVTLSTGEIIKVPIHVGDVSEICSLRFDSYEEFRAAFPLIDYRIVVREWVKWHQVTE